MTNTVKADLSTSPCSDPMLALAALMVNADFENREENRTEEAADLAEIRSATDREVQAIDDKGQDMFQGALASALVTGGASACEFASIGAESTGPDAHVTGTGAAPSGPASLSPNAVTSPNAMTPSFAPQRWDALSHLGRAAEPIGTMVGGANATKDDAMATGARGDADSAKTRAGAAHDAAQEATQVANRELDTVQAILRDKAATATAILSRT